MAERPRREHLSEAKKALTQREVRVLGFSLREKKPRDLGFPRLASPKKVR